MRSSSIAVLSGLVGAAIAVVYFYLQSKREGLAYLSFYDQQDLYKNRKLEGVPPWPTINTSTTSLYNVNRKQKEHDKEWYDQHPEELYSKLECV
jgi:hypothetical protein